MSWQTVQLSSVAVLDRRSIHPTEADADTPYVGLEHVDGGGAIESSQTIWSAELKSNKFIFTDQHVLFGKLRPYLRKIARPEFSGVCSTDIIPILPKDTLSRDYLFHLLRTPALVELATSRSSGANLPRLSPTQLADFPIPLPPLTEQKRIAGILDVADALRVKRREALAQLDTLLQSAFLEMFGDPIINPMGWTVATVGDEISFLTSGSRGWAKYYSESGDVFIRIQNLRAGRLDLEDIAFITAPASAEATRTRVRTGDVLLSITADLGRTAVVPPRIGKAHINQHLAILRFVQMDPVFVSYQLASEGGQRQFKKLNREGVKAGLNFDDVRRITLTKPPLSRQRRFATIVESVERQKARMRAHLAELDALFASLQSRAFSGTL